jgi:hypothetical protein
MNYSITLFTNYVNTKQDNLSDIPQYLTRWKIKEEKYGEHVLTELLEICIID